ncbi:MAG: hypothetical protein K6A36_04525, partial [Paludibacteraceae bacterium]|nr:hypothetical protein [Paludibacteraceae bacterium]
NKVQATNSFNQNIPQSGMLIYHVHKDIERAIINNEVNSHHPLKCYIASAISSEEQPTNTTNEFVSYNPKEEEWPFGNSRHSFTANTMPAAISWAGEPTGVDLCFIRRVGENIEFVVNPQIEGPNVLVNQDTFSIPNIPANAEIRWKCKFRHLRPTPNIVGQPKKPAAIDNKEPKVTIVSGENSSSLVLKVEYEYPRLIDLSGKGTKLKNKKQVELSSIDNTNLTRIKKEISRMELTANTAGKEQSELMFVSQDGKLQRFTTPLPAEEASITIEDIIRKEVLKSEAILRFSLRILQRIGSLELTATITYEHDEPYHITKTIPCYISYEIGTKTSK